MSKDEQSVRRLWNFKQSTSSKSHRTDLNVDEFIQRMCDTQISFKAVQKDSNNSVMQIKKKRLYWLKDISTHRFAWYHEQSSKVNYNQKIEWYNWDSSHAFECSNESKMQTIHDLDIKSTSRSSSHHVKLWNQVRDLHAKFKCHQSIWSSLAHQTAAYTENEKNIKLHSWISTQLSKEQRDVADIQWANEHYARD